MRNQHTDSQPLRSKRKDQGQPGFAGWVGVSLVLIGLNACSGSDGGTALAGGGAGNGDAADVGHSGGNSAMAVTGGGTSMNAGGSSNIGGTSAAATSSATGGRSSVGGSSTEGGGTGGNQATGGSNPIGGRSATGGTEALGGTVATGGVTSSGGSKATGGVASSGGSKATGGAASSGGSKATGGLFATGGVKATGGLSATGGVKATGGAGGSSCPYVGHVTYTLTKSSNPTATEQTAYGLITTAMDKAVSYYNCYTNIAKADRVSYDTSVQTADGNINGSIRFGSDTTYMDYRSAMHEISHTVGIGQASNWSSFISNGLFTGASANAQLTAINATLAAPLYTQVHADSQHFWPYGINYQSEVTSEAVLIFHCEMVMAIRKDLGL
jgi:hypothetical protein